MYIVVFNHKRNISHAQYIYIYIYIYVLFRNQMKLSYHRINLLVESLKVKLIYIYIYIPAKKHYNTYNCFVFAKDIL